MAMPCTMTCTLHVSSHLIISTTFYGSLILAPILINEETEVKMLQNLFKITKSETSIQGQSWLNPEPVTLTIHVLFKLFLGWVSH